MLQGIIDAAREGAARDGLGDDHAEIILRAFPGCVKLDLSNHRVIVPARDFNGDDDAFEIGGGEYTAYPARVVWRGDWEGDNVWLVTDTGEVTDGDRFFCPWDHIRSLCDGKNRPLDYIVMLQEFFPGIWENCESYWPEGSQDPDYIPVVVETGPRREDYEVRWVKPVDPRPSPGKDPNQICCVDEFGGEYDAVSYFGLMSFSRVTIAD